MDYLILSVGLAIVGLLLALFPRDGARVLSLDPLGSWQDHYVRRTRWAGIAMAIFAVVVIVLNLVKPDVWP